MPLMDFIPSMFITETRIVCILKINIGIIDKAGLVGKILLQGKNDYKDGGIFYGLFLAPKIKVF